MLDWIYTALGAMMRFFNTISGHYAVALLFYALVFKIVFLPFTIKQQKNQIKMAKLAPKIELIKAKYKGRTDQPTMQKQQQEIMELQQKEGYNPMSGCLPLLIQMPIIILLYAVIQSPLSYISKTHDDYNVDMLAISGITEASADEDFTATDKVFRLYLDYSSDSVETKKDVLEDFLKTKEDKGADKAYKNLKKTLKTKEISLVGSIRGYIDNGYTVKEDVQALLDKPAAELTADEATIIQNIDIITATAEDGRRDLIELYGIEYDSIPNFMLWGVNLAVTPKEAGFSILWLIPVLAALAQWFTMWLMRKVNPNPAATPQDQQTAASMKIMDLVMPGMTLFLAFSFSGMLGIYWIYQSILGLANSLILAKLMPMPKFTEDEIKEMRRQEKEVEKAARAAAKKGPKYRSLHYIDDEDYDTLPEMPDNKKGEGSSKGLGGDIPEIKD